jgi:hypothetical protein
MPVTFAPNGECEPDDEPNNNRTLTEHQPNTTPSMRAGRNLILLPLLNGFWLDPKEAG